jgi:hypothetical protein
MPNREECWRQRSWPDLRYYLPRGAKDIYENQKRQETDIRDGPLDYEADPLRTRVQCMDFDIQWNAVPSMHIPCIYKNKQTKSVALSPQANYTDWSTATYGQNLVRTFVDRGVSRGQRGRIPYGR